MNGGPVLLGHAGGYYGKNAQWGERKKRKQKAP